MPSKTIEDFANQVKSYALGIKDQQVLGAWNLLENKASSEVVNGVTFTVNADKSVTINGTSTGRIWFSINDNFMIDPGTKVYIASGNPTGSNIDIQFNEKNGSTFVRQTHVGAGSSEQSVIIDNDTNIIQYLYFIENAKTVNNVTLYPMISLKSNQPYVPNAMTNRELTDRVDELDDDKLDASALAPIENGSTASQAYNVGDYLIRDNELYTAAINIAMGDSLVVDTNITKSTLNRILMGSIVANSDLDNYYRSGRYCCGSSSAAQSLTHKPSDISAGFVMDVYNGPFLRSGQSVQMTTQIIMCVNTAIPAIYMRQKAYSGSFSDWYKFTGTVV